MSTKEYLQQLGSRFNPKVILDIGANIGEFKQLVNSVWPNSRVIMFEANSECGRYMAGEFFIKLLGNENKMVEFYKIKDFNYHGTGNSIYKENSKHYTGDNFITETLEMVRLDDLIPDSDNLEVDFVKIDTQGSEIDIIKGGLKNISKAKHILLEVAFSDYNSGAPQHDEVINFMESIGYFKELELDKFYDDGKLIQIDCLFTKKLSYKSI